MIRTASPVCPCQDPGVGSTSTRRRPHIDPASTACQLSVDRMSTRHRPEVEPEQMALRSARGCEAPGQTARRIVPSASARDSAGCTTPYFLLHFPSFLALHLLCSFLAEHLLPQAFVAGAIIKAEEARAMASRALRCFKNHLLPIVNSPKHPHPRRILKLRSA